MAALAYLPGRQGQGPGTGRKAALLGIAAAVGFGFVAAVVKELSTHLSQGPTAVFLNWSPYVLLLSGAAAMFLASNAFQAGSLAASQPGLTIVDPLVAGALGVVLFGESLRHNPVVLLGEVLAVAVVIASVIMLSQSPLVQDEGPSEVASARPAPAVKTTGDRVRVARLPRALRRPMSSLVKGKGSASDLQVTSGPRRRCVAPVLGMERERRSRPSPRRGPGETAVTTTAGQLVSPPTKVRISNPARLGRLIAVAVGLAALFMIPWTVFLGYTLPRRYDARHWSLLWIGFDVILCVVLTTFAWLTWKRRQLMLVTAIIAGTLLFCDAWFDVITSWGNRDHWVTVITALFAELPLAAFMFWLAYRAIRRSLAAYYAIIGQGDHPPGLLRATRLVSSDRNRAHRGRTHAGRPVRARSVQPGPGRRAIDHQRTPRSTGQPVVQLERQRRRSQWH